ncbi:hypothetical protein [Roseicyclus mahoneyensis]|uniref:Uncharacterized protein n=1 Tax=Roseicyclus mahoneyensis TaxID=164332 RepID=A0A316GNL5_9RHOB|nr:hypothetical protein [Roseicyclus mahoneyensis]PWK62635.1 hypothetical protein C7455_101664 [Roseicyclus mahoneyensis]
MANYDDPFYRSQGIDPNRARDPYKTYEGGAGAGILVVLLLLFGFLGLLFVFAGGAPEGDEAMPAGAPAVEQPATPAPVAPDGTLQ